MARMTLVFYIILTLFSISQTVEQQQSHENQQQTTKTLSRKKRYLIFPTGSSVSVAVCMTVGVYGNPQFSIWSWAVNYGFAYNLPTNATYFSTHTVETAIYPFYNSDDESSTTTTTTTTTEEPITHHDYHDDMMDSMNSNSTKRRFYVYRQPQRFETQPMMHRRYRRDMYRNIEAVIDKMGYNGRDCVLQALCESSSMFEKKKRRTMVQEMIKTIFTMPKSKVLPFEHPELLIYDEAYRNGRKYMNCEKSYSKCNFSLIQLILGKYSNPFTAFM